MKAFTLVEMLIVVGILVFLTGFSLTASKSGQSQLAVLKDQAQVLGVLNQAKSMTLERPTSTCGFGVYFPAAAEGEPRREYVLFQDKPPLGGNCPADSRYSGESEKTSSFLLDARVSFSAPAAGTSIVFIAPYLETNLKGTVSVVIKNLDGRQASVFVTPGGQIGSISSQ